MYHSTVYEVYGNSHIPLQSVDGSPRLPLFQNGACPFRGTPLLSVLVLVTHTWRYVVPLLPRFRIMAVSMQRLQISRARISAIPIAMIHLDPVVMLEEQPAGATTPLLLFQQPGQSWIGVGMPSLPRTPVHPIAIVRTAVPLGLDMPRDGHLTMEVERHGVRAGRRSGKGLTSTKPTPVAHT